MWIGDLRREVAATFVGGLSQILGSIAFGTVPPECLSACFPQAIQALAGPSVFSGPGIVLGVIPRKGGRG